MAVQVEFAREWVSGGENHEVWHEVPPVVHEDGRMITVADGVLLVGDIYGKTLHAYSEGEWKHAHVLPEPG